VVRPSRTKDELTVKKLHEEYKEAKSKDFFKGRKVKKNNGALLTNEFLLSCLEKTGGNISKAAQLADCSRTVYYKRMNEVEGFEEMLEDIRETKLDAAEDILWQHIEEGNPNAVMFYLKTIGKTRGYTTATDINVNGRQEVEFKVSFGDGNTKLGNKSKDELPDIITLDEYN